MGWKDLEKRLIERFGLGSHPLITRRLYKRLQREVDEFGEYVMRVISECAECSSQATVNRGAWFRSAVVARLKECGYLRSGKTPVSRSDSAEVVGRLAAGLPCVAQSDCAQPREGGNSYGA